MKKAFVPTLLALIACTTPLTASVPIVHPPQMVNQAYSAGNQNLKFSGSSGLTQTPCAIPGVLVIDPGTDWANFIGAARDGVTYTVKTVTLQKQTPSVIECADVFPSKTITQENTPDIRLTWPLMYEIPGTAWTLTILYGTPAPYDDDGPGTNPAGYVHIEVWTWQVDTTVGSLRNLLTLFHQLPFGLDEVPLISDEMLYPILQSKVDALGAALNASDYVTAGVILGDFEMEVMDAAITTSPAAPCPTGPTTGIAISLENPACCKLLADAEFIGYTSGIVQPAR